jgi:predicted RNA-binding protein
MLVAQDIAGRWEGYLDHSEGASSKDGYKDYWERGIWKEGTKTHNVELSFKSNKKKTAYTGEYYTEDASKKTHYARFAIRATVDKNGAIHYKTTSKIFETKNQLNQGFCFSEANLTWSEDKKYEYLEGVWTSWDDKKKECAPAHIWIRQKKRFKDNPEPVLAVIEKIDTVVEMNVISPPKVKDTLVQEPLVSKPAYSSRKLVTKETLHVPKDSIWIQVSDSNREDGDIISLEFNGQLLIKEYTLTTQQKGFRVRLQPGVNILTLIAHNLGEIPPNTAALEIERAEGRKRIILESDMDTSESIQIIKE